MHSGDWTKAMTGAFRVYLSPPPSLYIGYYVYIIHSFYFTCADTDARKMIKQVKKEMV